VSDRLVFLPYRGDTTAPWADVVVEPDASDEDLQRAAKAFAECRPPYKVFLDSRTDPRFIRLAQLLDEEYALPESEQSLTGWGYSVWTPEDFPR
jgi:hypothetical protein